MDLRTFSKAGKLDPAVVSSLHWYQPYFFSDTLATGVAASWLMKGFHQTVLQKENAPKEFSRFWDLNQRLARMYQDWINTLCRETSIDLGSATVLDVACNTGYFLYELKRRGARACLGIDQADFDPQRAILSDVTGIRDIEFRRAKYSSENHALETLSSSELFDLVIAVFISQHLGDPLHFIREISRKTRRALLFEALTFPDFPYGMAIRYIPNLPHHTKWGNEFPNHFDAWISSGLMAHALKACGFRRIVRLHYRPSWLPFRWYFWHSAVVAIR